MLSFGMFSARALSTASRSRKLESASLPPSRAAITISRVSRVKIAPRLASAAPFLRLIVDHFECPDMSFSFKKTRLWEIMQSVQKLYHSMLFQKKAHSDRLRAGVNNNGRRQFINRDAGNRYFGFQFFDQRLSFLIRMLPKRDNLRYERNATLLKQFTEQPTGSVGNDDRHNAGSNHNCSRALSPI